MFGSSTLARESATGLMQFSLDRSISPARSVESFNGRFRDELLNEQAFPTLFRARSAIEGWRIDYNLRRSHTALAGLTPAEFIQHYQNASNFRSLVAWTSGARRGELVAR